MHSVLDPAVSIVPWELDEILMCRPPCVVHLGSAIEPLHDYVVGAWLLGAAHDPGRRIGMMFRMLCHFPGAVGLAGTLGGTDVSRVEGLLVVWFADWTNC